VACYVLRQVEVKEGDIQKLHVRPIWQFWNSKWIGFGWVSENV